MRLDHEIHNTLAVKAGVLCFKQNTFSPEALGALAGVDADVIADATEDDFRSVARLTTISSTCFTITYNPQSRQFIVVQAF